MNKIFLFLALFSCFQLFGQSSEKYNSEYENFYRAEELFMKEQYAAARKEFRIFIDKCGKPNDPMFIKASYYEAISALELYNNDALTLLEAFNTNYPESIYKNAIFFKLGQYFYYKKQYDDAIVWFNKLNVKDVEEEDRDEFHFKLGYANFKEKNYEQARSSFYEIKDGTSQYANPALYYYSYIAYMNKSYEIALDGFLKLENDENFGKLAPYYIAQIYYLQGKYEEVTKYASKISAQDGIVNEKDLNLLIGDAFYRIGKFDEAVPYLEAHYKASNTTRDENYRLGFAYYKSKYYAKAIPLFDKVKKEEDSLGQAAFYHIGECLLKLENLVSARSAFEGAAFIDADPVIAEDALFNYAILSYKLDINPYDEAVEAFELYLNRYPNSTRKDDVYQYLVNVYTSTNNYEKALASLDKLPNKDIKLKMAYQMVAFNQGVKRYQVADYTGAISSFKLVDKYPVDPAISGKATYWTADSKFRLGKYDEAIEGYKKFLLLPATLSPGLQHEARYNIGYSYLEKSYKYDDEGKMAAKKDMLEKAITEFRLFIQGNPTYEKKKADANMRIADAYFILKDNAQAVKFYSEALALKVGYEDQALYYRAKTYGYMEGKTNDRIASLLDIVNNYKSSKYLQISILEIAESYKSLGQFDKAIQYYKKIVFDYPASNLVVEAKINIADIHYKQGKYNDSEEIYLEVLEEYGADQKVCKRVAEGLVDLYIAMNKPERIESLAAQHSCFEFSADEQENLYYLPAVEVYGDSSKAETIRYTEAIPKFNKYLEKFPSGRYQNEVKNYLANCHYKLGDTLKAIEIYIETLEGPNTGFTELAASRVAHYLYNTGQYTEVIKYYKRLEQIASTPEVIFNAKLGLMRSNFLIENWPNAALYADKVLTNTQLSSELKLEAFYARGMSNFYMKHYNDAKPSLEWLVKNTTTARGAEAQYSLAASQYYQENLLEADAEITKLLKMKPTYNYWVAKGLILRSRILIQLEDLFGAEQNLKSILDHYPADDDGILDEAQELYDELMQLKNQERVVDPDVDPIIEINEQGN